MNKNKNMTRRLVKSAMVAALYVVVTLAFGFISYGSLQFRISEVLVLLAFFDPLYIVGLTLGCFIANMLGPNGPLDAVIGTFATFLSVGAISLTGKYIKNKFSLFIASLWPVIFNGLIVGAELVLLFNVDIPIWLCGLQVAFGELVVITIVGVPMFMILDKKFNISKKLGSENI